MNPPADALQRTPRREHDPVQSLFEAGAEVFSAGQQLLLDRVDLLQAEVGSDVKRLATSAALLTGASAIALLGWAVLTVALAVLLDRWLPLDGALGLTGALDVALGASLGALAYRRMSLPTTFDVPTPALEVTHA